MTIATRPPTTPVFTGEPGWVAINRPQDVPVSQRLLLSYLDQDLVQRMTLACLFKHFDAHTRRERLCWQWGQQRLFTGEELGITLTHYKPVNRPDKPGVIDWLTRASPRVTGLKAGAEILIANMAEASKGRDLADWVALAIEPGWLAEAQLKLGDDLRWALVVPPDLSVWRAQVALDAERHSGRAGAA